MPNRETHTPIGAACGVALAYYRSEGQLPTDQLLEAFGGLLGGMAGARFADIVDVPTSPCHRSHAHSVAGGAVIAAKAREILVSWESDLRRRLQEIRIRKAYGTTDWDRICLGVLEILLRIAVGFLSGLIAGHVSHLVLDAFTPHGLTLA
jgi:hypothetical protein